MSFSEPKKCVLLFAVILLISLGLCGLNLQAFRVYHLSFSGGPSHGPDGPAKDDLSRLLTNTALVECAGIFIGAVGLAISLILWISDELRKTSNTYSE